MKGSPALHGHLHRQRDLLADDAPHTAAQKVEVEDGQHALAAIDARRASHDGLVELGLAPGPLQSVAIGDAIGKDQRVDGDQRGIARLERIRIGKQLDPFRRGQLEVIATAITDAIPLPRRALSRGGTGGASRAACR